MWEQVSLCLPTHLPSYLPLPSLYTSSVIPGWRQLADIALDGAGASTWVSQWWVLVVDVCSGKSWGTGRDDHSGAGGLHSCHRRGMATRWRVYNVFVSSPKK